MGKASVEVDDAYHWGNRLNWLDCLHILNNYEHFFDTLSKYTVSSPMDQLLVAMKVHIDKAKEVWALYYPLVCLTAQAKVSITEKEVIKFGATCGMMSPCTSIFVYHYWFFLKQYSGLEKYSNFALESKHAEIKQILANSTSQFSQGEAKAACQQIHTLI